MPNLDWYKKLYGKEYTPIVPDGFNITHGTYTSSRNFTATSGIDTVTVTVNRVSFIPFPVYGQMTVNRAGICVSSALAGSCVVGIYTDIGGLPGTLIVKSAPINTAFATSAFGALDEQVTLPPGMYWLASTFSTASGVFCIGNTIGMSFLIGNDVNSFPLNAGGFKLDAITYPTLPTNVIQSNLTNAFNPPNVCLTTV
jgi:hypothetical protein